MTQREFDGDMRADSISSPTSLRRLRTQASNFSLCSRSAAWPDITTVSIPNCRKHSDSRLQVDSFSSTKAARAAALRDVVVWNALELNKVALSPAGFSDDG